MKNKKGEEGIWFTMSSSGISINLKLPRLDRQLISTIHIYYGLNEWWKWCTAQNSKMATSTFAWTTTFLFFILFLCYFVNAIWISLSLSIILACSQRDTFKNLYAFFTVNIPNLFVPKPKPIHMGWVHSCTCWS